MCIGKLLSASFGPQHGDAGHERETDVDEHLQHRGNKSCLRVRLRLDMRSLLSIPRERASSQVRLTLTGVLLRSNTRPEPGRAIQRRARVREPTIHVCLGRSL